MDESGHDHRNMPYEVRGGIALHAAKLWPFIQSWRRLELDVFGAELAQYKKEIKGCKLMDKDRLKWARQGSLMPDEERRRLCRVFFTKGLEGNRPCRDEFTAYGQACRGMAEGVFDLLCNHDARLFASVVPRTIERPFDFTYENYLRKDHVFLFERYFYFLEEKKEDGLVVMDESDQNEDTRFVRRLHNYFQRTATGRYRSTRIVPVPFFVASDMAIPIQAADLCIYCVNWGFRLPLLGMTATERLDVKDLTCAWIAKLQYHGEGYKDGQTFKTHGIVYVPDPYESR
ncbi:MAG: hypothetical protein A2X46_01135 [Lentisphaerae bacterium GWF2_57_35]|nr:MAG: hypothetical protein A2X46_01135 [Lentisphaerae bacterium GWF2_57_35]